MNGMVLSKTTIKTLVAGLALFFLSALFAVNAVAQKDVITLYGQSFTIDTQAVNIPGEPYQWRDTAYLIPQIFPGILEGEERRSIPEILETLGSASVKYQHELYGCSIYKLAQKMEENGQIDAAFMVNEDGDYKFETVPKALWNGTRQERIDNLYGEIGYWFARNTWQEKVTTYNKLRGQNVLRPIAFLHPYQLYQYSRALYNLDVVVRQSPEVQAAGLQDHGVVKPTTPDCFKKIGSHSDRPVFQGRDSEDDVVFPFPDDP